MTKFTKIISVMLAVILVVMAVPFTTSAATLGDVNDDGEITAVDARLVLQVVAGLKKDTDLKNPAGADLNGDGISAVDARIILRIVAGLQDAPTEPEKPSEPEKPQEPSGDSEKAQMAALFNSETAKATNGTYKWERNCRYVKPLAITEGSIKVSTIQGTVDKFLGIGTTNGNQSNAGKNKLIAMNLTEADIKSVQVTTEQITLFLNDVANPTVGGNTSFSHVSNDIITKADAESAIKNEISSATLNKFHAYYYDIKVTAYLTNGAPTGLSITYKLYAKLTAKALGMTVSGEGTAETTIEYTDLNY